MQAEQNKNALSNAAEQNPNPEIFKILAGAGAEFVPEKLMECAKQNMNPDVLAGVSEFLANK